MNQKTATLSKASLAAYKAHRTRKMNALQREYNAATTAGKKAAIKRKMNVLANQPLAVW